MIKKLSIFIMLLGLLVVLAACKSNANSSEITQRKVQSEITQNDIVSKKEGTPSTSSSTIINNDSPELEPVSEPSAGAVTDKKITQDDIISQKEVIPSTSSSTIINKDLPKFEPGSEHYAAIDRYIKAMIQQSKKQSKKQSNYEAGETIPLHIKTIKYLSEGNSKELSALFSKDYVNIFNIDSKKKRDNDYFAEYFKSKKYINNIKGKPIGDLADIREIFIKTYDQIIENPKEYYVNNKAGFEFKEGDALLIYKPKKDSVLTNGIISIYRKEGGDWKIVAGSL